MAPRFVRRLVNRLVDRRVHTIRQVTAVKSAVAIPDALDPGVALVVGSPRKWLVLGCPCGCREVLWLNLMPQAFPRWRVTRRAGTLTVRPSVDAVGCGSHFWVTRGKIEWV